ncbi:hypothetical protein D0N36_03415 [Hymenobacter lapidiphilus]|uniref:hypothetical protein n=1 Tax=Hymenobacter sp. CCM 8763 TaxID=2303334 RepID=UPI000E3499C0|nr:hypothetical protein [Hymenobacter sp. CCM 8763]RFP66410.1 hypothetical protein D0N36_03415 [Hymenobacter sp. CCM 8763]
MKKNKKAQFKLQAGATKVPTVLPTPTPKPMVFSGLSSLGPVKLEVLAEPTPEPTLPSVKDRGQVRSLDKYASLPPQTPPATSNRNPRKQPLLKDAQYEDWMKIRASEENAKLPRKSEKFLRGLYLWEPPVEPLNGNAWTVAVAEDPATPYRMQLHAVRNEVIKAITDLHQLASRLPEFDDARREVCHVIAKLYKTLDAEQYYEQSIVTRYQWTYQYGELKFDALPVADALRLRAERQQREAEAHVAYLAGLSPEDLEQYNSLPF